MKPLLFATTSSWKYKQAERYLAQFGIAIEQAKIELPESRSEDVLEIAKEKALYAYSQVNQPVFVIDGAFHIKGLNGFPKTYVKYAEKYIGARGVLKLLEEKEDKSYEWPNVLYYTDGTIEKHFTGYIRGTIVDRTQNGSPENGFDFIQLPEGYKKTFSQMNNEDLKHYEENVWRPTIFGEFTQWLKQKAPFRYFLLD